jgi:hypothetical protein
LRFENLESRVLMSRQAILDFDGAFVSEEVMREAGWADILDTGKANAGCRDTRGRGFNYIFTGDPEEVLSKFNTSPEWARDTLSFLDYTGDGIVDGRDAKEAIARIFLMVDQHYSPYDLSIRVGNSDADGHALIRSDSAPGDVLVVIAGRKLFPRDTFGSAGGIDQGNRHDNVVYVDATEILTFIVSDHLDGVRAQDQFVGTVAKTISHEMGHAFGLCHPSLDWADENPALALSSLMKSGRGLKAPHDGGFLDVSYETSDSSREWYPNLPQYQNAHQILSDPGVLGPSPFCWAAVLKPGELTIHGDDNHNEITVAPQSDGSWSVNVTYLGWSPLIYRWEGLLTHVPITESFVVTDQPTWGSLNPFGEPINRIRIYGKGGADVIDVSPDISASLYAYGGRGTDTIYGGSGSDRLYGQGEVDHLYGREGNDRIYGGSGNDYLFGDGGNDYLFGEYGTDYLYGMAGTDRLWGGWGGRSDQCVDFLYGGTGRDIFYLYSGDRVRDREPFDRLYWQ